MPKSLLEKFFFFWPIILIERNEKKIEQENWGKSKAQPTNTISLLISFFVWHHVLFRIRLDFWFCFRNFSINKENNFLFFCFFVVVTEMAMLLPAELSKSRHENDTIDIRRNLRLRYRDTFKHNRDHE